MGRTKRQKPRTWFASVVLTALVCIMGCATAEGAGPCETKVVERINRILAHNLALDGALPLNAFTIVNEAAVSEARKLDQEPTARGPLHCALVAVKDNIDTFDMTTSAGTLALLGSQPQQDAELVARLRKAGAIVVGKSTMDELAGGIWGVSSRHGRTSNVFDRRKNPGGSSSGSAVAVAAGFADFGIGTDNSGSIRIPATYNGLYGLRPTKGLVPEAGIFPRGHIDGVPGPIAASTQQLAKAMDAIAASGTQFQSALTSTELNGKRLGWVTAVGGHAPFADLSPELKKATQALADTLKSAGAQIVENVSLPAFDGDRSENLVGDIELIDRYLASFPSTRESFEDICKSGRTQVWKPPCSQYEVDAVKPGSEREKEALARIAKNQKYVQEILEAQKLDALLLPIGNRGYPDDGVKRLSTVFGALSSNAGLPALGFVIGATDGDPVLPIGFQMVGARGSDATLVGLAHQLHPFLAQQTPPPPSLGTSSNPTFSAAEMNNAVTLLGAESYAKVLRHGETLTADNFAPIAARVLKR